MKTWPISWPPPQPEATPRASKQANPGIVAVPGRAEHRSACDHRLPRPSASASCGSVGGGEDVNDEYQGVRALDACRLLAGLAVALCWRYHEHDPAADWDPDEAGVPPGDELAEREHVGR